MKIGTLEAVQLLLRRGADPNDNFGGCPFIVACRNKRADALAVLLGSQPGLTWPGKPGVPKIACCAGCAILGLTTLTAPKREGDSKEQDTHRTLSTLQVLDAHGLLHLQGLGGELILLNVLSHNASLIRWLFEQKEKGASRESGGLSGGEQLPVDCCDCFRPRGMMTTTAAQASPSDVAKSLKRLDRAFLLAKQPHLDWACQRDLRLIASRPQSGLRGLSREVIDIIGSFLTPSLLIAAQSHLEGNMADVSPLACGRMARAQIGTRAGSCVGIAVQEANFKWGSYSYSH